MKKQDQPVENTLDVLCHLCHVRKDPGHDDETEGWKYDFYNHNLICPACQEEYEKYWPFPHYDEEEVKFLPYGARFTARAFRRLVGPATGQARDEILTRFFRDHSIDPIYGDEQVVIHPGREIWVYFH